MHALEKTARLDGDKQKYKKKINIKENINNKIKQC